MNSGSGVQKRHETLQSVTTEGIPLAPAEDVPSQPRMSVAVSKGDGPRRHRGSDGFGCFS